MNLGAEFERTVDDWKRVLLRRLAANGVGLEELAGGYKRNPMRGKVMFAEREFPTASGKVNLIHDAPVELPPIHDQRPLLLMALSSEKAQAAPRGARSTPRPPPDLPPATRRCWNPRSPRSGCACGSMTGSDATSR